MLRIAGHEVRPGHRGELRVVVMATRPGGLGQVHAYLVADLLRRYAERSRLAPSVVDFAPADADGLRAACDVLNIHPPRHTLTEPFATAQLDGLFTDGSRVPVFDVGVRLPNPRATAEAAGEALAVPWIDVPADGGEVGLGEEPLTVRLKLLGFAGDAAATLGRWRAEVAKWAESPSGAISRPYADALTAAFEDGLDTRSALRVLTDLEADDTVPDGVKFETFAAADRLFGLDLARDIGR